MINYRINTNKSSKYYFLYLVLVVNALTFLNSQAVYAVRKCVICGVGEYKGIDYNDCCDFDNNFIFPDKKELLSAEYHQGSVLDKCNETSIKEDGREYFVKCTHCADLRYMDSLSRRLNSLTIGKSTPLTTAICYCVSQVSSCGLLGAGVTLCSLKASLTCCLGGSCSMVGCVFCTIISLATGCALYCHGPNHEENSNIDRVNKKIQDNIVKINQPPRGVDQEVEVRNEYFNTIFTDQITSCYDNITDKALSKLLDKEIVMILMLYEKWLLQKTQKTDMSICDKDIRENIWKSIGLKKADSFSEIIERANDSSTSFIYSHIIRTGNNKSTNKNKDSNLFCVSVDQFSEFSKNSIPGNAARSFDIIMNNGLVYSCTQNKFSALRDCLRLSLDIGSFIISLTFDNNSSIQILFYKSNDVWEVHYPQLFGGMHQIIDFDGVENIISFLSNHNEHLVYKKAVLIIPEIFQLYLIGG